jgi:hypothetical protein
LKFQYLCDHFESAYSSLMLGALDCFPRLSTASSVPPSWAVDELATLGPAPAYIPGPPSDILGLPPSSPDVEEDDEESDAEDATGRVVAAFPLRRVAVTCLHAAVDLRRACFFSPAPMSVAVGFADTPPSLNALPVPSWSCRHLPLVFGLIDALPSSCPLCGIDGATSGRGGV